MDWVLLIVLSIDIPSLGIAAVITYVAFSRKIYVALVEKRGVEKAQKMVMLCRILAVVIVPAALWLQYDHFARIYSKIFH